LALDGDEFGAKCDRMIWKRRLNVAEWTNNPTITGAYWEKLEGAEPDIVWIHNGKVFGVVKTTFEQLCSVEYCASKGAMFYGPLDLPPVMSNA